MSAARCGLAKMSFYDDTNQYLGTGSQVAFNAAPQLLPIPKPSRAGLLAAATAMLTLIRRRSRSEKKK